VKKYCFTGVLMAMSIWAQAQNESLLRKLFGKTHIDTSYITSYYDKLQLTGVSISKGHSTIISDRTTDKRLIFAPNTGNTFGLGVDYKILTFEFTRAIQGLFSPDPQKGKSESFGFRFGLTGRKWLFSGLLQGYNGLYIKNPQEIIDGWNPEVNGYPNREDLSSFTLLLSLNYVFNPTKYSNMAALWQIDRQKKSAGSFMCGITLRGNSLTSDSTIVPSRVYTEFPEVNRVMQGSNGTIGFNFGYGHNFVYRKRFFANVMFVPGINMQNGILQYTDGSLINYESKLGVHGDFRLITGYNGERYYWGLHYANYFLNRAFDEVISMSERSTYFRLFAGVRFTVHKEKK
jgi:hypothetical protein